MGNARNHTQNKMAVNNRENAFVEQRRSQKAPVERSENSRRPFTAINANLVANRVLPREANNKQKAPSFKIFVDSSESMDSEDKYVANIHRETEVINADERRHEQSEPMDDAPSCLITTFPVGEESCDVSFSDTISYKEGDPSDVDSTPDSPIPSLELTAIDDVREGKEEEEEEIYANDIYHYLLEKEKISMAKPSYMTKQPDINHAMRSILVDWMVEVSSELELLSETLYIAVNLTDRFLSKMSVLRSKLQLVGSAALFLAAKYEEIYPPPIKQFIYLTDDSYPDDQLLRMERLMMHVLDNDIASPTPSFFLTRINRWAKSDKVTQALSQYIVELAMTRQVYICHLPSVLSASAICVAKHVLGYSPWTDEAAQWTGYTKADLTKCSRDLCNVMKAELSSDRRAVGEKYGKPLYYEVSFLNPPANYPF